MATQGTSRLKIVNDQPAVEKLWNGRYRLEFFCDHDGKKEDWHADNIDRILPAFGIKQGDKFGEGEWSIREGAEYADMQLVETGLQYVPAANTHYVRLVYETLTSSFVQEIDDAVDYELNGLRRVTRRLVAEAGTDYQKDVGTDTITHQIDAEAGVTLYLAGYEIEDTDAYRRVTEQWLEAGTLSVSTRNLSEGVNESTTVFLVTEGTTVGPIVAKTEGDFEGLKTITVKTLTDKDGNSLVFGGTNLVNQYKSFTPFTYPGEFVAAAEAKAFNIMDLIARVVRSPAQCKVLSTTYVFFQDSSDVTQADYTYDLSSGLYSPNVWGSARFNASGSSGNVESFTDSQAFRGFRSDSSTVSGSVSGPASLNAVVRYNGSTKVVDSDLATYKVTVNSGPPDPVGSKWTTDVSISPAFEDIDGNLFYKKVIVVTDAIPAQVSGEVPYD